VRHQAKEDDVANHGRNRHGDEDAPGARESGADRLFGDVGRGVVPGEGPLGLQEGEHEGERQGIADCGAEVEAPPKTEALPLASCGAIANGLSVDGPCRS